MDIKNYEIPLYDWFIEAGMSPFWAGASQTLSIIVLLFIVASVFNLLGKRIFLRVISRLVAKSNTRVDDVLEERGVFYKITLLFPALAIYMFDSLILANTGILQTFVISATNIYVILVVAQLVSSVLKAIEQILATSEKLRDKPLTSYRQVATIINYGVASILVISILIDKSPMYLLSALGALTAVLLLVFRDSILGLTASIQLASNDMVRLGDWVTVDKYGADGDVIEISLSTIKVRNFDKTISTVPTYAFISNSFKNWRGMEESDGRRIKRSLSIDLNSVRFANESLLKSLSEVDIFKEYISDKETEIKKSNEDLKVNTTVEINGRRQTNLGMFRKYMEYYLRNHPQINSNMTCMVRQLEATEGGLPLQVYAFILDKRWVNYEGIVSDLFDHFIAAAPHFGLRIYQKPSGSDLEKLRG